MQLLSWINATGYGDASTGVAEIDGTIYTMAVVGKGTIAIAHDRDGAEKRYTIRCASTADIRCDCPARVAVCRHIRLIRDIVIPHVRGLK